MVISLFFLKSYCNKQHAHLNSSNLIFNYSMVLVDNIFVWFSVPSEMMKDGESDRVQEEPGEETASSS